MKTASLETGTLYFVRLPYEGGSGFARVLATRPHEVYVEWVHAPSSYYRRIGRGWLTARSIVRPASAVEVSTYA